MWLRNVSESDVSSSYIHRPARFCSALCSDQISFTAQFMEKFITKNSEIIDSVKYMKQDIFWARLHPAFSVTSSWELTAEIRAVNISIRLSSFIWTERKTRGTASEDRTLKVRRTWSWKHLNDCVMSDWPPAPRRQRSAVDVPVSFRQGGDLWGERQHGVTAGRSFKLGGGGDYPQYTATYLQRGETLTVHVGAWWTLTLTTFCW